MQGLSIKGWGAGLLSCQCLFDVALIPGKESGACGAAERSQRLARYRQIRIRLVLD